MIYLSIYVYLFDLSLLVDMQSDLKTVVLHCLNMGPVIGVYLEGSFLSFCLES